MRLILRSTGLFALILLGFASAVAQAPVGEVFAADSSIRGSVLYAGSGTTVLSGSQVAAGGRPAVLKLTRGGEIRICPNTSVGVAASPNGRNLLFSVNQGEIEFHFDVKSDGDALQTPDYRVQFIGPAHFDLALCTDNRGGLALRGNNNRAAVIVSEMMGDGVYQVSAGDSIDFQGGTVANPRKSALPCGCPEPALDAPPQVIFAQKTPLPPQQVPAPATPTTSEPTSAQSATLQASETHVQVDAPFVFRGAEPQPEVDAVLARMQTIAVLDLGSKLQPTVTMPVAPPPTQSPKAVKPAPPEQKKRGFFRKLGSFFGKIFKG